MTQSTASSPIRRRVAQTLPPAYPGYRRNKLDLKPIDTARFIDFPTRPRLRRRGDDAEVDGPVSCQRDARRSGNG